MPRTKPRTEPVSLCSLAVAVVRAWRSDPEPESYADELEGAMIALERHLGPLLS